MSLRASAQLLRARRPQVPASLLLLLTHIGTLAGRGSWAPTRLPHPPPPPEALSGSFLLPAFTSSGKQGCTHLPPRTPEPSEAAPVHGQLPHTVAGIPSTKKRKL